LTITGSNNWVYQYNIDPASDTYPIGYAPIFLNFFFQLQPTKAVNNFVLRRSFISVLSIYGGLTVAVYFICWFLSISCRTYDAENELYRQFYVLNSEE